MFFMQACFNNGKKKRKLITTIKDKFADYMDVHKFFNNSKYVIGRKKEKGILDLADYKDAHKKENPNGEIEEETYIRNKEIN